MEKNCRWYFDKSGQALMGPNDSIHETFKSNPYYSVVRESIQNSLDAILDPILPVKVVFSFEKVQKNDYPNLFDIKKHIVACWQTHRNDKQAVKLFEPMANYINQNSQFEILRISDYNTKGMNYDPNNIDSEFLSFVRSEGKSSKSDIGSGGSFGFGKGAYYVLSKLKTLIVSTKTASGKVFFEGKTRLATHKIGEDYFTRDGFYNRNYTSPVEDNNEVPDFFKRTESGTDIIILGLTKLDDRKIQMIKSVLNNFWLAIHHSKLVVQIDDVEINSNNLEEIIEEYFPNEIEEGGEKNTELWNPKPYFKAVKYANRNKQFLSFSEKLDTLGEVKLYIYLEKGLPNRVSYFRKSRMVIFKRTNKKVQGYAAVFLCENEKGNQILKEMENPAHNEWKKDNFRNEDDAIHADAKKADKELSEFINSKLDELNSSSSGKKLLFYGLEEYLSIPEDLLEQDDNHEFEGGDIDAIIGLMDENLSEVETGSQTTIEKNLISINPTINPRYEILQEDLSCVEDSGQEEIAIGGHNDTSGGNQPGHGSSDELPGGEVGNLLTFKTLRNSKLKVVALIENGYLYHTIILNVDKEIPSAELELMVGTDNGSENGVKLLFSDKGNVSKNTIINVNLKAGRNLLKVRFADNLKHAIKIKVYELQ